MKPRTYVFITILILAMFGLILSGCAPPSKTTPQTFQTVSATEVIPPPSTNQPSATIPPGQVRRSAIAGSWYPEDPQELKTIIDSMLTSVKPVDGVPIALIVPHAGYFFSGMVAAYGFKQLENAEIDVAVIIASDHQEPVSHPISVWSEGGFETPLGIMPVDVDFTQALLRADHRITFDPSSHEFEHPIEIQLPFLQRACPGCKIVPVLMGGEDDQTVQILSEALLSVITDQKVVIIASSDLSHYPSYEDALTIDGATLGAVETGDSERVVEAVHAMMEVGYPNLHTCACGLAPIQVAMRVAEGLGADTITILRYANSGDTPYGNKEQVVGYGSVMFWHYQPPDLNDSAVTVDPRFPPLTREELDHILIEISVLSPLHRVFNTEEIELGVHVP